MPTTQSDLDRIAAEYHSSDVLQDKQIEDICQEYTYEWVTRHLAEGSRVLEMGYGEGNFTSVLSKLPLALTVLEGSPLLVRRVECSLFEDFNPDRTFDAIVATHVLEHVDDPVALLVRIKSWLERGGRIIVIVPNSESIHRQLAVKMALQPTLDTLSPRDHFVGHQRVYSTRALKRDIRRAGFRVLGSEGFFLKVLPNSMMRDYSPELVQALNAISPLLPDRFLANIGVVAEVPLGNV
jgi:2-polyprenyl-3-methyl-5-hydroxy-6-metoxy-1,4-benzoquinol methylase